MDKVNYGMVPSYIVDFPPNLFVKFKDILLEIITTFLHLLLAQMSHQNPACHQLSERGTLLTKV